MSSLHSKFQGVDTSPLFAAEHPQDGAEQSAPRAKIIGRGACPTCSAERAPLVRAGEHLAWGLHWLTTWGGAATLCRCVGTWVCVSPPRVLPEAVAPGPRQVTRCPCQGEAP